MSIYLFTYGTLMNGNSRHAILEDADYLQNITISGLKLYDFYVENEYGIVEQNYPVALKSEEDDEIIGEIYRCDESILPVLNVVENVGELYDLYKFELDIDDKTETAYIYVGISSFWEPFCETQYLKPYPNNTIWTGTKNRG